MPFVANGWIEKANAPDVLDVEIATVFQTFEMSRCSLTVPVVAGCTAPVNRSGVRIAATTGNDTVSVGRNPTVTDAVWTAATAADGANATAYCVVRIGLTRNATAPLE